RSERGVGGQRPAGRSEPRGSSSCRSQPVRRTGPAPAASSRPRADPAQAAPTVLPPRDADPSAAVSQRPLIRQLSRTSFPLTSCGSDAYLPAPGWPAPTISSVTPALEATLKNLPDRPPVYLMKDTRGQVLHSGKAQ